MRIKTSEFYDGSHFRNWDEVISRKSPDRLFVHQTGDGFVIVSEFLRGIPEIPLAVGIFLLRYILANGEVGKCGISKGEFADIIIREKTEDSGLIR